MGRGLDESAKSCAANGASHAPWWQGIAVAGWGTNRCGRTGRQDQRSGADNSGFRVVLSASGTGSRSLSLRVDFSRL
eukprot:scaffold30011_cov112-Isochrysis_galbana.AAC.2